MIINHKSMCKAKLKRLLEGYSAYTESDQVTQLLIKELQQLEIPVFIDRTPHGNWFIPEEAKERTMN
ncbi:hypothetical protein [Mechercharimyces sp. CAU 1602]|uniref:hypothetical protein n=1 Tax=Mechercharimyces sp. CAU 1602 TaxID=2973933 RepID=UPI0021633E68|nr:hypothetical protein [Mechercharimyces sp. CAU 1602]MCS1351625.1 hypothetical protein [Mechercharimyces sp. CAU 1602]